MQAERISRENRPGPYKFEPRKLLSEIELNDLASKIIHKNISELYYHAVANGIDFLTYLNNLERSRNGMCYDYKKTN